MKGTRGQEAMTQSGIQGPALLLVNARARSGEEDFRAAGQALLAAGVTLAGSRCVQDPAELPELIGAGLRSGTRTFLVGGGDGTISLAAHHLVGHEVTLGVLPLGTGNDFARSLDIPPDLAEAARIIAAGEARAVDLGLAGDRAFLNAASVGVTTQISRRLRPGLKRRAGRLAYPVAALSSGLLQPFRAELVTPKRRLSLDTYQVVVGNGRYHGGGRLISKEASLEDQLLDVYAIEARSASSGEEHAPLRDLATLARVALRLRRGRHVDHPAVLHLRTPGLRLRTEPSLEVDVDGELIGHTPIDFSVLPRALRVLAPARPPRPPH